MLPAPRVWSLRVTLLLLLLLLLAPVVAGGSSIEAQIRALYREHNPAKLGSLPKLTAKYGEEKLLAMVREKYGADAPPKRRRQKRRSPKAGENGPGRGRSPRRARGSYSAQFFEKSLDDVLEDVEALGSGGIHVTQRLMDALNDMNSPDALFSFLESDLKAVAAGEESRIERNSVFDVFIRKVLLSFHTIPFERFSALYTDLVAYRDVTTSGMDRDDERRAPPLGHRGRPARRLAAARDGRVLHDKLLAAPEHAPLVLVQRRHDAVEERPPPGKLRREGVAIQHVDE